MTIGVSEFAGGSGKAASISELQVEFSNCRYQCITGRSWKGTVSVNQKWNPATNNISELRGKLRKLPMSASQKWNPAAIGIGELPEEFPAEVEAEQKGKTPAQQSCARKAGFLYLLKQQFSFSLKHKY